MTGASVHVPHLLCPNQLRTLPAAIPQGIAENTFSGKTPATVGMKQIFFLQ